MKTAISVPNDTYERASRRAEDLGMSRSEFFSRAAVRYMEELDRESLTEQIDQAVGLAGETDHSTADAVNVAHRLLSSSSDEW
jgi:hypothetical protein